MIYLQLFLEFFKIGLFAIGGGLATLPFLQDFAARSGRSAVEILPLQMLAYYVARERGCDIDKPKNLAKSVTVE